MGTFQAVSQFKHAIRKTAAAAYARMPGRFASMQGKIVLLTYHRVVSVQEAQRQSIQPGMYVTPETFDEHLELLSEEFLIIPLSRLYERWNRHDWDSTQKYCVITFDDGWLDTYENAWPLLRRRRVPATVFLPTAYIGTDRWFWPDLLSWCLQEHLRHEDGKEERTRWLQKQCDGTVSANRSLRMADGEVLIEYCKRRRLEDVDAFLEQWCEMLPLHRPNRRTLMNWAEVSEMSASGVEFGSHSVTHRIMTTLLEKELEDEVVGSFVTLLERRVNMVPVFCYPNGNWSPLVAEAVRRAGYRAATTTQFGYETPELPSPYGIKRINIHEDVTCSKSLLAFHLAGFNQLVW